MPLVIYRRMEFKWVLGCVRADICNVMCILSITVHVTYVVCPKNVLIFYLNVYWTHLKLQVISFKV